VPIIQRRDRAGCPASSRRAGGHDTKRAAPKPQVVSSANSTVSEPAIPGSTSKTRRPHWPASFHSRRSLAIALSTRPQGRRQARPGAAAPERRGPSLTIIHNAANPRHRAVGQGEMICGWRLERLRERWRQRENRSLPRSDIWRPFRKAVTQRGRTRSSPAATASSATWCWK